MLKGLVDLTSDELKNECEKAGVKGIFTYEEALIRLTIHLVREKSDPFTFQFDIVEEPATDISEEFEAVQDTIENEPNTAGDAVSVPFMADEESAGTGSSWVSVPQTFGRFASSSFDSFVNNVAEEDAMEKDIHKNWTESDPAGVAELSGSLLVDAVSAGYSLVSLPSSVAISSLALVISQGFLPSRYFPVSISEDSILEIKYQEIGNVMKTQNFLSDLWPPDLIHKTKRGKFVW